MFLSLIHIYVAEYQSSKDLANGIHWALTEGEYESLSEEACRKAVSSYSESTIAKKYVEIYNKITGKDVYKRQANTGTNITVLPEFTQADVIHLHWINQRCV